MSTAQTSPSQPHTSPFVRSLLAGALAGTTVDLTLFPLDTLKTRLQSSHPPPATQLFRGIYSGVLSAALGSAPGAALFFVSYEATKEVFRKPDGIRPKDLFAGGEAVEHMLAASVGEVAACAVRVPTEVVKQRAQAAGGRTSAAWKEIWAYKGLRAKWGQLYRGYGITILREVPFTCVQFPLWEYLKAAAVRRRLAAQSQGVDRYPERLDQATTLESAGFGAVSGVVAAAATTPLDVLKTRMMLSRDRVALWQLAGRIWREEGGRVFFSGIGPRCGWIGVGGAVFLGAYQWGWNQLEGIV